MSSATQVTKNVISSSSWPHMVLFQRSRNFFSTCSAAVSLREFNRFARNNDYGSARNRFSHDFEETNFEAKKSYSDSPSDGGEGSEGGSGYSRRSDRFSRDSNDRYGRGTNRFSRDGDRYNNNRDGGYRSNNRFGRGNRDRDGNRGGRQMESKSATATESYLYFDVPPTQPPTEVEMALSNFQLSPNSLRPFKEKNITSLYPIQAAAFHPILNGEDIVARAKTGTGKTLSFVLPIIEKLSKAPRHTKPKVLILAPVRELATQISTVIKEHAPQLKVATMYGGTSVMGNKYDLNRNPHIIVGTPGRLIDLHERGILDLSGIETLVFDEADVMLEEKTWGEGLLKMLARLPKEHQTVLFSATLPASVKDVVNQYVKPDFKILNMIDDRSEQTSNLIDHYAVCVKPEQIHTAIAKISQTFSGELGRTLVFVNQKRVCDDIAYSDILNKTGVLHGDITQNTRERTLQSFRDRRIKYLIATDVAARGIDIPELDLIIQVQPPDRPEMYVHRSGRTGRAGRKGVSVLLFTQDTIDKVSGIERAAKVTFQQMRVPQAKTTA